MSDADTQSDDSNPPVHMQSLSEDGIHDNMDDCVDDHLRKILRAFIGGFINSFISYSRNTGSV